MNVTVADVCRLLEERLAPLCLQESYDNAGLQLGDPSMSVSGILVCLDVSEAVLDEARETGCNMVVSHHPLLFSPLRHITGRTAVERCVAQALRQGIAVYSGHTNVDSVWQGVSGKMCEKLGLQHLELLVPSAQAPEGWPAGLGMVGELPAPMSETDFLGLVGQTFGCRSLRYSALTGRPVGRVALCGGAGGSFLEEAVQAGADVYVTADLKYHDFSRPDGRLLLVDAGHYETEQFTKELFFDVLSKNISTFAVRISGRETNPVNYL